MLPLGTIEVIATIDFRDIHYNIEIECFSGSYEILITKPQSKIAEDRLYEGVLNSRDEAIHAVGHLFCEPKFHLQWVGHCTNQVAA